MAISYQGAFDKMQEKGVTTVLSVDLEEAEKTIK